MIVYRLSKKAYIDDLSGRGAELNGGRWNNKGIPVLYTACSRALAVLEVAVHIPFGIIPKDYFMVAIEVPDAASIYELTDSKLPANWNRLPISRTSQNLGDTLLKDNKYLVIQVPSAIVPGDYNYLINPRHTGFSAVKVLFYEPFEFDSRLFSK